MCTVCSMFWAKLPENLSWNRCGANTFHSLSCLNRFSRPPNVLTSGAFGGGVFRYKLPEPDRSEGGPAPILHMFLSLSLCHYLSIAQTNMSDQIQDTRQLEVTFFRFSVKIFSRFALAGEGAKNYFTRARTSCRLSCYKACGCI